MESSGSELYSSGGLERGSQQVVVLPPPLGIRKQAFWAASAATVKGVVAVFGNRVLYTGAGGPFGFFSNDSVVFFVSGASARPSAPLDWRLSECFVPHTGNITTGDDSWAYLDLSKGVINHGGFVYLFGFVQVRPRCAGMSNDGTGVKTY